MLALGSPIHTQITSNMGYPFRENEKRNSLKGKDIKTEISIPLQEKKICVLRFVMQMPVTPLTKRD